MKTKIFFLLFLAVPLFAVLKSNKNTISNIHNVTEINTNKFDVTSITTNIVVYENSADGGSVPQGLKGELKKKINAISKFDTLVIDELGYLPMNKQSMFNFFQLINALYEYRSIIITTNKDFTNWGDFFFDDNVAVPIVDRIIHHSYIFMMGGESYRLKQKINLN